MRGKVYIVIAVFFLIVAVAYSQGVSGMSISFLGTGQCDTPAAGKSVLCVATVNGQPDAQVSVNGSPMTSLRGKDGKDGAQGPQGVPGVGTVGPQGIQGIPGPATLPKACTMKITGVNPDGSWAVAFSNCS